MATAKKQNIYCGDWDRLEYNWFRIKKCVFSSFKFRKLMAVIPPNHNKRSIWIFSNKMAQYIYYDSWYWLLQSVAWHLLSNWKCLSEKDSIRFGENSKENYLNFLEIFAKENRRNSLHCLDFLGLHIILMKGKFKNVR